MTIRIDQLIAAGLMAPRYAPPGQGVLGFRGVRGLGKVSSLPGDPAEISTNTRGFETGYSQVSALANQLVGAANEVAAASQGIDDPTIAALVDDAQLLAQEGQGALSEASRIYNLEQSWVETATTDQIHGGWAFGREYVLTEAGKSAPGNRSGRPLDGWNRSQILAAASRALAKITSELARALGQLRASREQVLAKAKAYRAQYAAMQAAELRAQQEQARQDAIEAQRQKIEDDRAAREQAAADRAYQMEEQRAQRAIEIEEQRNQAALALEDRRAAMQEQVEQRRIQADEQRLQAELAAEQQRLAFEQSKIQQDLQSQQAQQAFSYSLEQQRQQAQLQAELSKLAPAPQVPGFGYGVGMPHGGAIGIPGYGVPQGILPAPLLPPAWPAYQQAVLPGAQAAYPQNFGPIGTQSMPYLQLEAPQGWAPGGEMFGMRGMGASTLDSLATFLNRASGPALDAVAAARGQRLVDTAPAPSQSSGIPWGKVALAGAGLFVLAKVFGGKKKSGGRRRGRR